MKRDGYMLLIDGVRYKPKDAKRLGLLEAEAAGDSPDYEPKHREPKKRAPAKNKARTSSPNK